MRLLLISLFALFTVGLNAQYVNNTPNSIEEFVDTISKKIDLSPHIKVTFNMSETNTALYIICDEDNHTYDVYIKPTDTLFYSELLVIALKRIQEIDNIECHVNWQALTYVSQKLAYKYCHLITLKQ